MGLRPIIVIDDHELAHSGIRLLLAGSNEFCLAGCFTTAREGMVFAAASENPVILLDLELPDIDGLSALSEIVAKNIGDVVVMTGVTRPDALQRAVDLGARGVVCKGDPVEDAHAALRAVAAGETFFSRCARDILARVAAAPVSLSERQQAILQLLSTGCSNKEISYRLEITPPTVSFHLAEIRRKLDAANSRQLVEKARSAGILANPLA